MTGNGGRNLLIGCALLERELRHLIAIANADASGLKIDLQLLEQGFHERPEKLRQRLQDEIDSADGRYDRIILAYGLCSNGLAGLKAGRTPLLVPRAHDCITLLLGSRQRYRNYFDQHSGTYWYSVGWLENGHPPVSDHLARKQAEFTSKYEDEDTVSFLLDEERRWIANYSRACFIRQGLEDDSGHLLQTQTAAAAFGWTFDTLDGNLGLLRDLVEGHADQERLLLVPPGACVAPTFDERIVTAIPAGPSPETPANSVPCGFGKPVSA